MNKLDGVNILHLAYFSFNNKEENKMIINIWKKEDLGGYVTVVDKV